MGLNLDLLDMNESVSRCVELISKRGSQHVVLNAAKVVMAQSNLPLRESIERADLVNADGMSVVWAARVLGLAVPMRVSGIDLMVELLEVAKILGLGVYLLGAAEQTVSDLRDLLIAQGVTIVGSQNGYWANAEELEIVEQVRAAAPDILFIALPTPQKEQFVKNHIDRLNAGLCFGVGGSFDVLTGRVRRAPRWMQRVGLEWVARMIQEPRRMVARYLYGNAAFVFLVLRELIECRRER